MVETTNPAGGGALICQRGSDGSEHTGLTPLLQASANPIGQRRDPRWEYLCRRGHVLGPRPMAELLGEIGAATGQPELVAAQVEAFGRLEPETVRALGADRFPPLPMEAVR